MTLAEFVYTVILAPRPLKMAANFIIKSILPETINVRNATIHLNPRDPVVSGALLLRSYENDEIDFFLQRLKPGMVFVDVGANVGLYTGLALSKFKKQGTIVSIEPDFESLNYLNQTIQSNAVFGDDLRIIVRNVAVSDSADDITLYKNSQNKGDNRIYCDPVCNDTQKITADTLDNICASAGILNIDFLKVDVQGAESRVLYGAKDILSRSADCVIMSEFWPYGISRCGNDPHDYLEFLSSLGFSLCELLGASVIEIKDFNQLIKKASGRKYINLIGIKGVPRM